MPAAPRLAHGADSWKGLKLRLELRRLQHLRLRLGGEEAEAISEDLHVAYPVYHPFISIYHIYIYYMPYALDM